MHSPFTARQLRPVTSLPQRVSRCTRLLCVAKRRLPPRPNLEPIIFTRDDAIDLTMRTARCRDWRAVAALHQDHHTHMNATNVSAIFFALARVLPAGSASGRGSESGDRGKRRQGMHGACMVGALPVWQTMPSWSSQEASHAAAGPLHGPAPSALPGPHRRTALHGTTSRPVQLYPPGDAGTTTYRVAQHETASSKSRPEMLEHERRAVRELCTELVYTCGRCMPDMGARGIVTVARYSRGGTELTWGPWHCHCGKVRWGGPELT